MAFISCADSYHTGIRRPSECGSVSKTFAQTTARQISANFVER